MIIDVSENIIRGSIIYMLKEAFGNDYKYYDELIEQNFQRPSFHIKRLSDINTKGYTGHQYKFKNDSYRYEIKYFTDKKENQIEDINNKIDKLKQVFEYLYIVNMVDNEETGEKDVYRKANRINSIEITVSDGVLIFDILFNIRTVVFTDHNKVKSNTLVEFLKTYNNKEKEE